MMPSTCPDNECDTGWHSPLSDSKWLSASISCNKQPSVTDIVHQITWRRVAFKFNQKNIWKSNWKCEIEHILTSSILQVLMFIGQSYRQITSYWLQTHDFKHIALTNSHHSYLEIGMALKAYCLPIYLLHDVRQPPTAVWCIKINTLNICWENIISCLSDLLSPLSMFIWPPDSGSGGTFEPV